MCIVTVLYTFHRDDSTYLLEEFDTLVVHQDSARVIFLGNMKGYNCHFFREITY
jgi:hypothetical protein